MWQVAMFFDPRVVKPVALGGDELTRRAGRGRRSGVLGRDPRRPALRDRRVGRALDALLGELLEREELAALVDGGVASNVPVELAWRRVQAGKLGSRNALYVAFDCFHPQWDPRHLWAAADHAGRSSSR